MEIIENIIEHYYANSQAVQLVLCIVFAVIIIVGFCTFIKNKRYTITQLMYKVIYSISAAGIGELLCLIGLSWDIKYVNFNAVFFLVIINAVMVYGILLCFLFKQMMAPILQCCKYIRGAVFLELFLLAVTYHLDFREWFTGTVGIVGIEVVIRRLEKEIEKQREEGKKVDKKETDYPDSSLYPTRQRQFDRFIEILEQQKDEPYAIMISGRWGAGKSSFVKALEEKLTKDTFIKVYAGSEKTVTEIMKEISAQIVENLEKNNIFIEHKDLIEKYFFTFTGLLEDTTLAPLKKIADMLISSKGINERDYLNSKLDDLRKTIYLIIDDLDRCDKKYQEKMFKVIRESLELHNCKVIFLVDKAKFLCENNKDNYVEKYVSFTLDLCDVDYQEIVGYSIDSIMDDHFIQEMNDVLLKERNEKQIKKMIYDFPGNLIERLEYEVSKEKKYIKNAGDNDKEKEEKCKNADNIEKGIIQIKKDIMISRKVKRYLKGIKGDIILLNKAIDKINEELRDEDWFKVILEVQFVKNFMSETYNNIRMCRDIWEFGHRYSDYIISIIFDLDYIDSKHNEEKEIVLNHIIYKLDVINFSEIRTSGERFLEELRNERGSIDCIGNYIEFAQTFDDLNKILYIYKTQDINMPNKVYPMQEKSDNIFQEKFIDMIFQALTDRFTRYNFNGKNFLEFSEHLLEFLAGIELSNRETALCISKSKEMMERIIMNNSRPIFIILSIVFDLSNVENHWNSLVFPEIDEIYKKLEKIDKTKRFYDFQDESDKLSGIMLFFKNMKTEFKNEKYKEIESDVESQLSDINYVFEICKLWGSAESRISSNGDESEAALRQYFMPEGGYQVRDIVFSEVSKLMEALNVLKRFYIEKRDTYNSEYSLLLLRLSRDMILQYEQDAAWFNNKKTEIAELLQETTRLVCKLDKGQNNFDKDNIIQIKIYTYKFKTYC